jgi:thioredoxin-like negative regulator of GroEL
VIFYKLDIDKAREVAFAFNVKSIPMLLYFKPRGEISSTVGYLNREELKKAINEYLLTP